MASAKETMNAIETQLADVQRDIERLRIEEAALQKLLRTLNGQGDSDAPRRRIPNVKPFVLQIMENAGADGATSVEVYNIVRRKHSDISKDTVSSVLSRLKSAEALHYDGERYFDTRFVQKAVGNLLNAATMALRVTP